jgi:hypothetical protein
MSTTRTLGRIGRYEVIISTRARPLSPYEIATGVKPDATTSVWLAVDAGSCCWQGTVERIIADPTCASSFLNETERTELAAMVAATRIGATARRASSDVRSICARMWSVAPPGDPEVDLLSKDARARIELDLLAAAESILDLLQLGGYEVEDAVNCLRDVREVADEADPLGECPGCGCKPGDGITPTCKHKDGCGREF